MAGHETKAGQTGHKEDGDKLPIRLVPVEAIKAIARVLQFGAFERPRENGKKGYGENNWKGGMPHTRLSDALERHILEWRNGEDLDPQSRLPHLWHALTCAAMLVWMVARRPDLDDRYDKPDPQPKRRR